ncbi:sugar ABC transporter ATP-binding protein [Corynebacterium choanae]|uniref:Ribose import ATP-binding protein RbsA n=1 Tax=Corynebacterium choanae TaxID=1862358 RepID=A0A3G6J5X0_9CORY|nr:sugar ABC transporter ATP-binding protein [Corynebacterium choanae]AZA13222.1 Ribose import ATP-binding protein RbsA [Corynebacterium choanae]
MNQQQPLLKVAGVDKRYGGVHALRDVHWSVLPGEVHALVGENGAGKSTLIKMISGAEKPDSGTITIDGETLPLGNTQAAMSCGISAVYQEPQLFADLTVAENIFLGREIAKAGKVQWNTQLEDVGDLLGQLELDPELANTRVGDLPVGEQQLVSIAKAFATPVKLLILDEPSAILADKDIDTLFRLIRSLTSRGISVIYISHRLDEIGKITDRVTVMRDGAVVETRETQGFSSRAIAESMVGEKFQVLDKQQKNFAADTPVLLDVQHLATGSKLHDASLSIRQGEIVGLYGLIGSGTAEFVRLLYGIGSPQAGTITVDGKKVTFRSPKDALAHRVTMLPGNRKLQGVFLPKSLAFNISCSHLGYFSSKGWFQYAKERKATADAIAALRVKAPGPDTLISNLSGGNQQKIVMARQLVENPLVLLAEEPTQGVDVGAKADIHSLIVDHVDQGNAALIVSTDLEEIRLLSDRIIVMRKGRTVCELPGDVSAAELLDAASGNDGETLEGGK